MPDLPEELLIEFKKPITFNGKTVDAIQLEEPNLGQIEIAKKKANAATGDARDLAFIREMIVLVGKVDPNIVSLMKISDIMRGADYLMLFMNPAPKDKTSETP